MFEESLLESAHLTRTQNRWPAVASLGVQAALAAVLLAIPALHPEVLPLRVPRLEFTPPAPKLPTPPVPRVNLEASRSTAPSLPAMQAMTAEPRLPTTVLDPTRFGDAPPTGPVTMNGSSPEVGTSLIASTNTGGHNIVVATTAKPERLRISLGVSAGLLLAPIKPVYPPIAIAARKEGTVIIHAMISKEGRIESANAVSGPMMLQGAALDAVRGARYRPYLLNGEPTEVDTTFSIVFHLGS